MQGTAWTCVAVSGATPQELGADMTSVLPTKVITPVLADQIRKCELPGPLCPDHRVHSSPPVFPHLPPLLFPVTTTRWRQGAKHPLQPQSRATLGFLPSGRWAGRWLASVPGTQLLPALQQSSKTRLAPAPRMMPLAALISLHFHPVMGEWPAAHG